MNNRFGEHFSFEIFGESHGPEIGVIINGLPKDFKLDKKELGTFLDRRAPGRIDVCTSRYEEDLPLFKSGLYRGRTTGEEMRVIIKNNDVKSQDYRNFNHVPRPGHADLPTMVRSGDMTVPPGGGRNSGRMTAPLCIAGGIALQLLGQRDIRIHAQVLRIAGKTERSDMLEAIADAREAGDSVGGIIQCWVEGLPIGLGEPMFEGLENKIAQAVFAIPGIKGIEFGAGFAVADMLGSENNDEFFLAENASGPEDVYTNTNNAGGILGGMASGMPIIFRVAVKPTPSIARVQQSVDMERMCETAISVQGRHDPCIVLRAVPCVEAAAAVAIYDLLLAFDEDNQVNNERE